MVENNIEILYNFFLINPDYKAECVADLIGSQAGQIVKCPTQKEFINKLLTDDDFYEKWGNDCCEEITTREMCEMFGVDYEKVTEWSYHGKNIDRDLEVRTMLTDPGVGPNYPKRKLKKNEK